MSNLIKEILKAKIKLHNKLVKRKYYARAFYHLFIGYMYAKKYLDLKIDERENIMAWQYYLDNPANDSDGFKNIHLLSFNWHRIITRAMFEIIKYQQSDDFRPDYDGNGVIGLLSEDYPE